MRQHHERRFIVIARRRSDRAGVSRLRHLAWSLLHPPRVLRLQADCWRLSERDLTRRWLLTYDGVTSHRRDVGARLSLVAERQRLLDEFDRRYPQAFREAFGLEGWRPPQHWASEHRDSKES